MGHNYLTTRVFNFLTASISCVVEIHQINDETILMNDQDWEKLSNCSSIEIVYSRPNTRRNLIILDVKLDNKFPSGVVGISEENSSIVGSQVVEIACRNRALIDYRIAKINLKRRVVPLYLLYFLSTFDGELSIPSVKSNLKCDCENYCIVQDLLISSYCKSILDELHKSGLIRIGKEGQLKLLNPSGKLTENLKNELGPIIGLDPHLV